MLKVPSFGSVYVKPDELLEFVGRGVEEQDDAAG